MKCCWFKGPQPRWVFIRGCWCRTTYRGNIENSVWLDIHICSCYCHKSRIINWLHRCDEITRICLIFSHFSCIVMTLHQRQLVVGGTVFLGCPCHSCESVISEMPGDNLSDLVQMFTMTQGWTGILFIVKAISREHIGGVSSDKSNIHTIAMIQFDTLLSNRMIKDDVMTFDIQRVRR